MDIKFNKLKEIEAYLKAKGMYACALEFKPADEFVKILDKHNL